MQSDIFVLAENLEGYNLNGWTVEGKIPHKSSTGGFFSTGYIAHNDSGEKGFIKALNYSYALSKPDTPRLLLAMTQAYEHEKALLEKCAGKKLRYVVRVVDSGHFQLPKGQYPTGAIIQDLPVDYLVLEYAETSVRNIIDFSHEFDYAWALRSLHNVAVGIQEMHNIQIAHQDIKPSNILLFENHHLSKVGDIGRSSDLTAPASHDQLNFAGDRGYSPFEQLYGEISQDWYVRRFSCDMFMFGNLISTYFNGVSVTTSVNNMLPFEQQFHNWGDTYQEVLPYLELAFSKYLSNFNNSIDYNLRSELISMVSQLCNPDILKRGDLTRTHMPVQQYSLQKYISRLDYWANKYEHSLKKVSI